MTKLARYTGFAGTNATFEVQSACSARECLLSLGLSKSTVARAFTESCVLRLGIDESPCHILPATCLNPGERIAIVSRITRTEGPTCREPVDVVFEDPFVLVVDKPQGILVHSDGSDAKTLTACVQGYLRSRRDPWVPQALQRLDFETSGAVLFSKTEQWQSLFDGIIAEGEMEKHYLAIVEGRFPHAAAVYRDSIGRDRHDSRRMRVSSSGQDARTDVRRLAYDETAGLTLLDVRLFTGRRHQIRVHLSSHGFPIVGDALYGSTRTGDGLMLHASWEAFVHPVTGANVMAKTNWPQRFGKWFDPFDTSLSE